MSTLADLSLVEAADTIRTSQATSLELLNACWANIDQAKFQDADLRGADLGGLSLLREAVRFRGAVVSAAQAELILGEVGLKVRAR